MIQKEVSIFFVVLLATMLLAACDGSDSSGFNATDGDNVQIETEVEAESEIEKIAEDGDESELEIEPESENTEIANKTAIPSAPVLDVVSTGTTLKFHADSETPIEIGTNSDTEAVAPLAWEARESLELNTPGVLKVFARFKDAPKNTALFSYVYHVQASYPPAADVEGSTAISMNDPRIKRWATEVVTPVEYGSDVDEKWRTPEKAFGAASGDFNDIVSLGEGGVITFRFEPPISDNEGYDFAVFENSFDDRFLELAFVEVSSDGETFIRFDSAYLGETTVPSFGQHECSLIGSLAGKYRAGYGTPFDLDTLSNHPDTIQGNLDLQGIRYIRIVDIIGDGRETDSFGHAIYDPYPTVQSAGFDLEAIGVLSP